MDSNLSQPPVPTLVDTGMHKEDQQATSSPTSLGVTSEARANPQLSSGMSAFNLKEPIYSASFIIHSESASGNDASVASTAEVDPGNYAPIDFVPQQQDLESPKDNPVIVVDDSDEDEDDEVHATKNVETKDTLVPKSSSHRSSQIQELTNQVLILQSQMHKLEAKKNKAEAEAALLKAQTSFPNMEQLNKLLVKSLKSEFSMILSTYDFSSSLPTELKDLPSKFNDLTEEWELPSEFLVMPSQVKMVQAKLKTLDTLPSLLNKVTNALNHFAQAITSKKTRGDSVPSAGQAGTQPAEGEKNTNHAIISQVFQRIAKKENLNKQQPKPTSTPTTPIITTTTPQMYSLFPQSPPKGSSQTEGEHIKKDKGKKVLFSEEAVKKSTESDSDDDETYLFRSMVESSRIKKKIKEEDKAKATKRESDVRKEELIDHLGLEVVNKKGLITPKVYKEDSTSEIIPNFKASDLHLGEWREVMKACPNRTGKGWETIYKQIGTRMDYIHMTKAELGINLDIPLSKQDPLDKLNDLVNKKRKHADDIHDYFKANKRLKSSVQYKDHLPGTVLNEPVLGMILFNSYHRLDFVAIEEFRDFSNTMLYIVQEIFFRLHQGPRLDDHPRTFSSLLLAEINKRNLNPFK
ncbi:hypothetical protein Tco_1121701 [Tanacetum coccineum]|uniref:Uncharacterized protein n=1 Tax=Tanacetum coccineum TaxID=301880 RepID=A0ABQ5IZF6_9ASTR